MCMIAFRPVSPKSGRGSNIPGAVIETALRRHPDGFGIAWREDGQMRTEKFGPDGAKRFRKLVKRIDRGQPGTEYVAHFRFATHGPKCADLAHPYEYTHPTDGRVLVFHNGIIDIATSPLESDTQVFVRDVLAHLPSRWWTQPALVYLVGEAIGWSKLVLMTGDETVNLHEKRGTWDGGIWYSSSHKPTPVTYKAPTGTTGWVNGSYRPQPHNEERGVIVAAPTTPVGRDVDRGYVYKHAGHLCSAIVDIDRTKDGDYTDAIICDICYTTGDVYVIDGGVYIDMAHKTAWLDADEENEEAIHAG